MSEFKGVVLSFGKGATKNNIENATYFQSIGDFDFFCIRHVCSTDTTSRNFFKSFSKIREDYQQEHSNNLLGLYADGSDDDFWGKKSAYTFATLVQFGQDFDELGKSLEHLKKIL